LRTKFERPRRGLLLPFLRPESRTFPVLLFFRLRTMFPLSFASRSCCLFSPPFGTLLPRFLIPLTNLILFYRLFPPRTEIKKWSLEEVVVVFRTTRSVLAPPIESFLPISFVLPSFPQPFEMMGLPRSKAPKNHVIRFVFLTRPQYFCVFRELPLFFFFLFTLCPPEVIKEPVVALTGERVFRTRPSGCPCVLLPLAFVRPSSCSFLFSSLFFFGFLRSLSLLFPALPPLPSRCPCAAP